MVDLVASCQEQVVTVENSAGSVRYSRTAPYDVIETAGADPLANEDPFAFAYPDAEPAAPVAGANAYPFGRERLAGLFDDPRAPDLVVVHTAGHYWPERGGHLGEHGSLDAVQSRAPLLLSGAGVTARGVVDDVARTVDVGPTLAHLAGGAMPAATGRPLAAHCGPGARHVVGLLWDGVNASSLLSLALSGELPNVARLLDRGAALRGGAVAEFPSVTLANHTSALTGVGPGRHGILHNAFYDRATGERCVPNDETTWHRACDWLRPGVVTLWEALPGRRTACVNEPVDRGAGYSTFGLVREQETGDGARGLSSALPDPTADPHASRSWVADPGYAWGTSVDALGLQQVLALWSDPATRPDVMWWNTTLTDTAHHLGGPHSEVAVASLRDTDRRLGTFLDLVDRLGLTDEVAVLLTSDHGSEAADPSCRGDWDEALRAAGVEFRDEAYGFVYLG
ncbi:MAG TPA: alkaline phosphatase family protein [Frankiaceae bacterium]|nr:alkaline phosphatase family protein [Frankiaceae bacterium]